jgi:hypothetical protein
MTSKQISNIIDIVNTQVEFDFCTESQKPENIRDYKKLLKVPNFQVRDQLNTLLRNYKSKLNGSTKIKQRSFDGILLPELADYYLSKLASRVEPLTLMEKMNNIEDLFQIL